MRFVLWLSPGGRSSAVTSRLSPLPVLLALVLAFGALLRPSVVLALEQADVGVSEPADSSLTQALPPAPANLDVVRQGYDLLLDRYVQPLNPAELLSAAHQSLARRLAEAGVRVRSPAVVQLDPGRDRAWAEFRDQVNILLQDSPPPAGFNPEAFLLDSMARWVNEGHTAYMTPQQYQDFLAYLRGDLRYSGIGIRPIRPGITVGEIFPGSPAEAAGMMLGDVITAVDGQPTVDRPIEQVAQLIRGPEGTAVTLEVYRPRTGEQFLFVIVRASIKIEYISSLEMIQGNIGYIRLRGFPETSVADRFDLFLDELPALGARGLVLDLRGNSGGRIDIGIRMLNRFIASGPLFAQVDRSGRRQTHQASGRAWADPLPVAILVDEATASMGEIFAAAMRDHGVARVIGKRTAGSVAGAQVFPLSDGSALQITVWEIYSGSGQRLNRDGVEPDDSLDTGPEDLDLGRDIPLETAVLYVWEQSEGALTGASSEQ
jgi:C-terminal peptidase prc